MANLATESLESNAAAAVAAASGELAGPEQRIVSEFCLIYNQSRQLFNGLRDLPQIGHKGWQGHFEAAFNAYTKLWRFQQQYRHILDSRYDLKRWQIGEIASKIGQLYYHYYLRTSDCSHLIEASNFYAAIRSRGYFNLLSKDMRSSLVIKKLRYFARYIVVCLLLKRTKLVKDLIREFAMALDDYGHFYEPEAQLEWSLVLQEIKAFVEADCLLSVVTGPQHPSGPGHVLTLSQRLGQANVPAPLKMPIGKLCLTEVLIVGNYQRQVKFSELTIDMYRILQILEREPEWPNGGGQTGIGGGGGNGSGNAINNRLLQHQATMGTSDQPEVVLATTTTNSTNPLLGCSNPSGPAAAAATTTTAPTTTNSSQASFNLLTRPTFSMNTPGTGNSQLQQQQLQAKFSPHKYLLFRPSFSQLFLFLAAGFKELPQNGVMLLYMSADGSFGQPNLECDEPAYDLGGLATNPNLPGSSSNNHHHHQQQHHTSSTFRMTNMNSLSRANTLEAAATCRENTTSGAGNGAGSSGLRRSQSSSLFKQFNCLHPGDLIPFTRKPLVLILESNNSYAFQHMQRHFGSPLLILMSPTDYPSPFNDNSRGSLFSLFLHCPLTALGAISNILELPEPIWRDGQLILDKFYTELGQIILQSRQLDPSFISLCSDDFLRLIILRFIFCYLIMRSHRLFRNTNYLPRSYPALPDLELSQHPILKQILSDLTLTLDIRSLFD